ncbi:MAG: helix-turn-helix domain-containing protein [Acidobacteriaceae bacterium]|nr:helix-turn-helix domain-containing protein [Acidobacteriaceae bacterium]
MESIGLKLREARLRSGLTLPDISAATRIKLKTLEAIENDDFAQIDSPFAYRSFARQFGGCVGLRSPEFDSALQASSTAIPEPLVPGQAGAPAPPNLPSLRPQRTKALRWLLSLASLVLMLVACSNLYAMWQNSRTNLQTSMTDFVGSLTRHAETPRHTAPVSGVKTSSSAPANSVGANNTASGRDRYEVLSPETRLAALTSVRPGGQ